RSSMSSTACLACASFCASGARRTTLVWASAADRRTDSSRSRHSACLRLTTILETLLKRQSVNDCAIQDRRAALTAELKPLFIALAVIVSKAWLRRSVIERWHGFAAISHRSHTVGRHSKAAKIFPLSRKAHSDAHHVPLSLVALGERFGDFLLQWVRFGDDRRKIIERQTPELNELAGIERQRGGGAEQ